MKFDNTMKLIFIVLFIAICFFSFNVSHAKMSGECWQGGKLSEQSNVSCRYLENKRYVGLYGFRNSKRYNLPTQSLFRPMAKRRIK